MAIASGINRNFQIYRGNSKSFRLVFTLGGQPVDLSGDTIMFTMKRSVEDANADAVIHKTITLPDNADSVAGTCFLPIESTETGAVPPGLYLYDLIWKTNSDPPVITTFMTGRVQMLPSVNNISET